MAGRGEGLLHGDAPLAQDVADALGVGEIGLAQHFLGQVCRPGHLLVKGGGAHDEHRAQPLAVLGVLVHFHGEPEVAQMGLNEGVQFGCRVAGRIQLAEHAGQHRGVGQLVEGEAVHGEVAIGVGDAAAGQIMADKAPGPALPHLPHRLGGRLADIGPRKLRKFREGLRRVRRLLGLAQRAHGLADRRGLVLGERRGRLALAGCLGLFGGLVAFRGHHLGAGAVVVIQEQLAQKRLEVPLLHLLAQAGEDVLEAQVGRRVVVGVQPSGHGGHGQHHAVGVAEVALAHDELGVGEGRPHQLAVEPALGEAPGLGFHDGAQRIGGAGPGAAQGHHGEGLGHGVGHIPDGVVGDARVEQRPLQGRLVGPHDGVHQDVGGHNALALGGTPDDESHGSAGVLRCGGHGHDNWLGSHGSLQPERIDVQRPALFRGQRRQIALV